MRISERMRYDTVAQRVHDAKEQNGKALERMSSQKDIQKLSDNPIGAAQIIRYRDQIEDMKQFQTNVEYSKGIISRTESALQSITDSLIRAKELAVGMSNDTYDKNSREATSREIKELIDQVVQDGNTTFNGRYVFGGFRNQTPALSQDGEYLGDDGAIFLQVSPGNFHQVNLQARNLFEANPDERAKGHYDMVGTLQILYEGLVNDDKTMIHSAMNELDHQLEKTSSYDATVGAMENSLDNAAKRMSSDETLTRARLSKVQDTDMYDASSEFKRTEAVLQGTLMSSTKLLQPSLLNFLQ